MIRLALLLLLFLPLSVNAESALFVSPEYGVYTIGEEFDVSVHADSGGVDINAAEAEITFNPTGLEVLRISTDGSILSAWPTPPTFSNQKGTIRFSGWAKDTYNGSDGLLVTIRFKALRVISSNAHLAAGAILAADGRGSNIITSLQSGMYSIEPEFADAEIPPEAEGESAESLDPIALAEADLLNDNVLAPPEFTDYKDVVEVGERIIVNGKTTTDTKVVFFFSKGNEKDDFSAITSDSDGSFTFISNQGAEAGVYRLRAAVQDANGRGSEFARVTVTARSTGLAAAASVGKDMAATIIPLLSVLAFAGLGAGYLYHRHAIEKLKHGRRSHS
ncbi:MAG: cohesin domain-containing protein [Minisyncoccia bacterium]